MALNAASILVTGGCGQIGMAIVKHFGKHHPDSTIAILDVSKPGPGHASFLNNVTYFSGDITNESRVREVVETVKPLVIFHTAGLIPSVASRLNLNSKWGYTMVNLEGTRNVLDAAKAAGSVKAFVLTSSCDVVKRNAWQDLVNVNETLPIPEKCSGHYAKSKALAEFLTLTSSTTTLPTTAIRTHAVFSANDNNLMPLILGSPRNIQLGPGTNLYDFTYAPNVAHAHILAAQNLLGVSPAEPSNAASAAGKAFFVTNDEPLPFRAFMSLAWAASDLSRNGGVDVPVRRISIPWRVAYCLIWIFELIGRFGGRAPALTLSDLGDSLAERWFDNSLAKEVLGYVPGKTVAQGLVETMAGRVS